MCPDITHCTNIIVLEDFTTFHSHFPSHTLQKRCGTHQQRAVNNILSVHDHMTLGQPAAN